MLFSLILNSKQQFMFHQFLVFLAMLITPILPGMVITGALITTDFITGLYAAKRSGELITSKRMRDSIDKIFVYNTSIVFAFLIEKYMLQSTLPILRIALGFISLAEFKSISENFHKITGINFYKKITSYLKKRHDIEL